MRTEPRVESLILGRSAIEVLPMTIESIERRQGSGSHETFAVRKQPLGVEWTFPQADSAS
jgi:hypothetical protein